MLDRGFPLARVLVAAALCVSLVRLAAAQEEEGAPAPPPPHSLKPRPAIVAPMAARYRLIDITNTGKRVIAVGQRGNIVSSTDGRHWQQVPSPVNIMLTRVRFIDESNGWIVGYDGAILHSTDGGSSWKVQHYDAEARQLYDIHMLDAQTGIAVGGYGTYLTTSDGGTSWQPRQFPLTDLGLHFNTLIRLGDGTLFIAGEKSLMAWSKDKGENWQMLNSPYTGSFFGALPLGESGVLVHGMRGNVYVTRSVTAAAKQDPATFDPATRTIVDDAAVAARMGWTKLSGGLNESMFGAAQLGTGEVLLVGVNGLSEKANPATGTITPLKPATDATLSSTLPYQGRFIGAGKRGIVDLGAMN